MEGAIIAAIMFGGLKKTATAIASLISNKLPDETIERSKKKWNKLAEDNARYYVVSRKGKKITENDFNETGEQNYNELVATDALVKDKLGEFSDKTALDIGCGIGRLEQFFAPDFKKVHGIDISEEMIQQARKRLSSFRNVEIWATDGKTYPFGKDTFDFIFSYLVFQHMPSRAVVEQNFKEIFRVLKPEGVAKIQIRGGHTPFKWQWFYGPSWNEKQAREMVEAIGFKVFKTEGAGTKRFWLWLGKEG